VKFLATNLPGVVVIEPRTFVDERGWFMESFNQRCFSKGLQDLGIPAPESFVQDNQSCSRKGVLRGLHYQREPHAQGKLVSVTRGAAFDVAVALRSNSDTYGKWFALELNARNKKMLWIPEGFAHGFLALEDEPCVNYKTTRYYNKEAECSVFWKDQLLGIKWPRLEHYLLSDKDKNAPCLSS